MIKNEESVIGSYMFNYLEKHKLTSLNKEERKLTMLLDTYGQRGDAFYKYAIMANNIYAIR